MISESLNPSLEEEFKKKKIDRTLTISILNRYNNGDFDHFVPIKVHSLPEVDGQQIIDMTKNVSYEIGADQFYKNMEQILPEEVFLQYYRKYFKRSSGRIHLGQSELYELGMHLIPKVAYGILNGGSATSYVDEKKNRSFSHELFHITSPLFEQAAEISRGKPKGVTPAFMNPDGTIGPSFLELKMRALLIKSLKYRRYFSGDPVNIKELLPMFQMTSIYTDTAIQSSLEEYRRSPLIEGFYSEHHSSIMNPLTALQPLIAAYTPSSEGQPKGLFTKAWGTENTLLPLPGGHGQNFSVLSNIYQDLYAQGFKYAYLGNIDNLGNTVNPIHIALLALSGKEGAFEFSFKTPVDIKGGILVRDQSGKLNAADIGPAISKDEVLQAENSGKPILFNCAAGIFDLHYLSENLDYISRELPTRFSDQDKDAGRYSQAEQITWEIIGMMENPLILGVQKYDRFLASKLLLENLMTSGISLEHPDYPPQLRPLALKLHAGLKRVLEGPYGLKLVHNKWIPKTPEEIE